MSRQQHTSSDERLLLISLFKEKESVLLSKKTEGKKALSKAKAWEDITSALNAAALGPPRSVKQTKKLWENMKGRAKKLYRNESNRTDESGPPQYCDMISAKVIDIIIKDLKSDINSKDVKNESTCEMGVNGTGCSGVSQPEICRVREEGQESFMDVNAEGEPSMADKNFRKGTPVTKKSADGSVQLKPKESSSSVLESLYEDSAFADVTLTAQGQSVRAHRAILSAKSLYFREVLQANPHKHPIIIMPLDVHFRDLQAIVSYIYKGEITLPSENLKSLLKTANALQISDLARVDVLGMTAIDSEDIASCKTEGVHSQSAKSINEHKEDIQSQLYLPVIAREDKLHDNRAECAFLLSSRKRPREEAFSETELVMPAQAQSKTPRLAEDNYSATPDETSMLAEVKMEDFEEYEEHEGLEDYTADDYKLCDKSLLQSEQFPGSHSDTAFSISIKEEPID